MTSEKTATRRRYSAAMKARVVAACDEPGASVAKVAMAHGINANVVHRWRQLAREGKAPAAKTGEFIALPLMVAPKSAPASADIRVELRRGPITMTIAWPASAAAASSAGWRSRATSTTGLAADNDRIENLIRPIALGRKNWLFAGRLRAGQRAAAIMSLLHTARLNGHKPYAYMKDVLEQLPTQPASRIGELLPQHWKTPATR